MKTIRIQVAQGDNFEATLKSLVELLQTFSAQTENEENDKTIQLDLTDLLWVHHFLIVPLAAFIDFLRMRGYLIHIIFPSTDEVSSYLRALRFENGLSPDAEDDWMQTLAKYQSKRYIPIVKFPVASQFEVLRDSTISQVNRILDVQLSLTGDFKNAVLYLIDEAINNIVQHSRVENGWIAAQYYPNKQFLDLTIADTGISILGSYKRHHINDFSTDAEAIRAAVEGYSTKVEDDNRGYGMRTSRRMLMQGLSGFYGIFSGNGLLLNQKLYKIPVYWPGTVVCMRIPKPQGNFDFYSYV